MNNRSILLVCYMLLTNIVINTIDDQRYSLYAVLMIYIILYCFDSNMQLIYNRSWEIHDGKSFDFGEQMFQFMLKSPMNAQYLREVKSSLHSVLGQTSNNRQQFLQSLLNPVASPNKGEWATTMDILAMLNKKKFTFKEIHYALLDRELIKNNVKIYITDDNKSVQEMTIFELITSSTLQSSKLVDATKLYVLESRESRDLMQHTRQPHYDCKVEWQSKYGHKTHAFDVKSGKLDVKGMSHIHMPLIGDANQLDGILNKPTSVKEFQDLKWKQTDRIIGRLKGNSQFQGIVQKEFEQFECVLSDPVMDFHKLNEANIRILAIMPDNRTFNPELVFPKPQHLSEVSLKESTLQRYCGTRINNLKEREQFVGNFMKVETPELIDNLIRNEKSWAPLFLNEITDEVFR